MEPENKRTTRRQDHGPGQLGFRILARILVKGRVFPAGMEHMLRQPPSGSGASDMAGVDLGAQVELFVER